MVRADNKNQIDSDPLTLSVVVVVEGITCNVFTGKSIDSTFAGDLSLLAVQAKQCCVLRGELEACSYHSSNATKALRQFVDKKIREVYVHVFPQTINYSESNTLNVVDVMSSFCNIFVQEFIFHTTTLLQKCQVSE